jgi:hypothetical protein
MTPTNEQLNRRAAEVLGWEDVVQFGANRGENGIKQGTWMGVPPGEIYKNRRSVPDFCTDRNALPELWAKVDDYSKVSCYLQELSGMPSSTAQEMFEMIAATPRQHTIAALKALDAWPEDWSAE